MQNDQILQTKEWGSVKAAFGWTPLSIKLESRKFKSGDIKKDEEILVLKRKLPLIKRCFFYIPRGPVIDYLDENVVNEFINKVSQLAKEHNALFMRLDPEIDEKDSSVINGLKKKGFIKAKKEIQPRSTYIVDIRRPVDEIRANFESKFRYNIKVAIKSGILVKENNTIEGVQEFHNIYKETSSRQTFIIHPLTYYKKVFEFIISKGFGSIFIAYKDNVPVAGVFIFTFGKRAWYMYGASSNAHRNMMPNNLIHWEVIKWAKEKGIEDYDLWGIPSNPTEKHPLWGVYRFKKGFNGKLVKFVGTLDYPFNKLLYMFFDKAIIMYQNVNRLIKKGSMSDSLAE